MTKVNLQTRILTALAKRSQAVVELSNAGFGTPNTIRKTLSTLRRAGQVVVAETKDLGLGRRENVWTVAVNNSAVA